MKAFLDSGFLLEPLFERLKRFLEFSSENPSSCRGGRIETFAGNFMTIPSPFATLFRFFQFAFELIQVRLFFGPQSLAQNAKAQWNWELK